MGQGVFTLCLLQASSPKHGHATNILCQHSVTTNYHCSTQTNKVAGKVQAPEVLLEV